MRSSQKPKVSSWRTLITYSTRVVSQVESGPAQVVELFNENGSTKISRVKKMMGKKSEFFGARLVITRCINYVWIQGSFKIRIIRRITIVFYPVRDVLGYEELYSTVSDTLERIFWRTLTLTFTQRFVRHRQCFAIHEFVTWPFYAQPYSQLPSKESHNTSLSSVCCVVVYVTFGPPFPGLLLSVSSERHDQSAEDGFV